MHLQSAICFLLVAATACAQTYTIEAVVGNPPPALAASPTSSWIGYPDSVATDSAGNVYFTSLHCVFRMQPGGSLVRFAGTGRRGYSGDGGPASAAQLHEPTGVAIDAANNVYIADSANHRIRRVTPDGIITTIAGIGVAGPLGDLGPAVSAQLDTPVAVATGPGGVVYVLDFGNNRVRAVSPQGIVTAFAGTGSVGFSGDRGPALSATFNYPTGMAVSPSGNLYLADAGNNRVRRIANGTVTTIAGNGFALFGGDGGSALNASLNFPDGVRVDSGGNVFISDSSNFRIRKVAPNGTITTVAGNGAQGFSGDGGRAGDASFNYPNDVAVDAAGNLYIADSANSRIRLISPNGTISTAAGSNELPRITSPDALVAGPSGAIYFTDSFRNQVFARSADGTLAGIAGDSTKGFSGDGAAAQDAQLNLPLGIARDPEGNLYIADSGNHRIRKISSGGTITTVAGNGLAGFAGDNGPATSARLNFPVGLAVDSSGNIFVADTANNRIRRISASGTISTVAGNGTAGGSGDGGPATSATLSGPGGVALDTAGNLYIADQVNNRVRRLSPSGIITNFAGTGVAGFSGDGGAATAAQLRSPSAVAADPAGNVFVADNQNHVVRRVTPGGVITTAGGSTLEGYSGDGGPAALSQLSRPLSVATDAAGNVFFTDSGNGAIRSLRASPQPVLLAAVADAASAASSPVSPGKIVALYGAGLGPAQLTLFPAGVTALATQLAGTSVFFNGIQAPVIYTSASQIAAIVPYAVSGTSAQVTVTYQGRSSGTLTVPLAATSPGFFTANSSGAGQLAAINVSTGNLNTAATPVRVGEYIALFATGEGLTQGAADGRIASLPLPAPLASVTAAVGGIPATIQYAGGVFGTVAGLMQINVLIPPGVQPGGYVPVSVQIGGVDSAPGVWISVTAQ